jgi:small conductance mechanosensitive channel
MVGAMLEWLDEEFLNSGWFLPARILLIVIAGCVARVVGHHLINRVIRTMVAERAHPRNRAVRVVARATSMASTMAAQRREQRIGALGSLARSALTLVLMLAVGLTVMAELGFNIAALLAGTSIVGIAVAFGIQTVLRDVISGILMLIDDQIGMGDYVKLADVDGVVEDVGLRLTQIRDADGTVWYIRNGDIAKVANYSQGNGTGRPPEPEPAPTGEGSDSLT